MEAEKIEARIPQFQILYSPFLGYNYLVFNRVLS